jgi:hypothetical protein
MLKSDGAFLFYFILFILHPILTLVRINAIGAFFINICAISLYQLYRTIIGKRGRLWIKTPYLTY